MTMTKAALLTYVPLLLAYATALPFYTVSPNNPSTSDAVLSSNTNQTVAEPVLPFEDPSPGIKSDADLTFYLPGEPGPLQGAGACGVKNTIHDHIVAISKGYWDKIAQSSGSGANGNNNPLCGLTIEITTPFSVQTATIQDRCGDCPRDQSLDVTPALAKFLFKEEGPSSKIPGYEAVGRMTEGVSWRFVDSKMEVSEEEDIAVPETDESIASSTTLASDSPQATDRMSIYWRKREINGV